MVQNFRSALHGFNREDVVRFIEQNTKVHEQELNKKDGEINRLQEDLKKTQEALQVMTEENARLNDLIASAPVLAEEPAPEIEDVFEFEAPTEENAPADPLDSPIAPTIEQTPPEPREDIAQMELTAYRRAEMTERIARERANAVYDQIANVFEQSTVKLTDTHQDMDVMAATVQENLRQLESMLDNLRAVYAETNDAFRSVSDSAVYPAE